VLDTPPEALFDDITRIAAQACDTPIALISLLDETRQWFKSEVGLGQRETPRSISFCDRAILGDALFEVPDALEDERYRENPLVTGPTGVRFYAGVPLATSDGHKLGTLCVLDRTPRNLRPAQCEALEALSRQVVALLELRRALVAQRRAESLTVATIDVLQDTIAVIDSSGTIVRVNRAWVDFARANCPPAALSSVGVGVNYLRVCARAAEAGAGVAGEVGRALRCVLLDPAEKFSFEYPCHAPGEQRWFIARIVSFRDGAQVYAIVSHQNITARRLAEQAVRDLNETLEERIRRRTAKLTATYASLRASEEKFRSIFENAAVGFATATPAGVLEEANTAFCAIAGCAPSKLIGKVFADVVDAVDFPALQLLLGQLLAGEVPGFVRELRLVRPDGELVWVHISVAAIRDRAGRPAQIVVLVQNVTPHKQAEYERDRFFELAVDMLAIAGFDGRLQRVNPAWTRVLGYEQNELLDMFYLDLVHPQDRATLSATLAAFAAGEALREEQVDVRLRTKAGTYREIRWSVARWAGEPRFVAAGRDVTRLRLSEGKLRAFAARLQGIREEERTAISRDIHDDLGQTLTALKMDLTLLGRDAATAGRAPDSARLLVEVGNMTRLVDSTLQSVRRIARQLRPEVLDALGLVPALEWQAQDLQARTGLQYRVSAADDLPGLDIDQRTALFRIVQEALTNVARHAGASSVHVSLESAADALRLCVQDDGCGFDIEDQGAHPSLGLLGMSERAAMIGAAFEVESLPGKGTKIIVCLPFATGRDAAS